MAFSMSARRVIVGVLCPSSRDRIAAALVSLGHTVTLAESPSEAFEQARSQRPQLLVADSEFMSSGVAPPLSQWWSQLPGTCLVMLPESTFGEVGASPDTFAGEPGAFVHPDLMIAIEHAVEASGSPTSPEANGDVQPGFVGPGSGTLMEVERAYIQRVLDEEQHVGRAAHRLGIARSTFFQKLRAMGISSRH